MAITRYQLAITFTATNDGINLGQWREVVGITIQGTGLTSGQRLTLRMNATPGSGSPLADYVTEAAIDNADLWVGRKSQRVNALSLDNTTVVGTWTLTVFFGDRVEPGT